MNKSPLGRLEVTDHHEMPDRGGFVLGYFESGIAKIGDSVPIPESTGAWTIKFVESLNIIGQVRDKIALVFNEHPSLVEVEAAFPIGSFVEFFESGQKK